MAEKSKNEIEGNRYVLRKQKTITVAFRELVILARKN